GTPDGIGGREHDLVPDGLDQAAARLGNDVGGGSVESLDRVCQVLRGERLAHLGEAGHVGKADGKGDRALGGFASHQQSLFSRRSQVPTVHVGQQVIEGGQCLGRQVDRLGGGGCSILLAQHGGDDILVRLCDARQRLAHCSCL